MFINEKQVISYLVHLVVLLFIALICIYIHFYKLEKRIEVLENQNNKMAQIIETYSGEYKRFSKDEN